jgi:hypothetical protein
VSQPPGDERHRERQPGQEVPRGEPEAEHRGGEEGGHEQLGPERERADAGGQLDVAHRGHRARDPLAARVPQPPQPREREGEYGGPAQQPEVPVDEERDEPVEALEVAAREGRVGGGLAFDLGGVGGGAAIQAFVDPHVDRRHYRGKLHRPHRERAAARAPHPAGGEVSDHEPGRHELRAEPGQRAEQPEAEERRRRARPRVETQRQQGGRREHGAGGQLGVDGRAVGEERRREPNRERGSDRPGVRHNPEGEPVAERHGERRDRGEEELDALGPSRGVGGRDQEREADAVRLVQPALGLAPVAVEVVRVEVLVLAREVLVAHVDVAVLHERLRRQQVVRLVPRIVGVGERVEAEGGGVGGQQDDEEHGGARHRPQPTRTGRGPVARAAVALVSRLTAGGVLSVPRSDAPRVRRRPYARGGAASSLAVQHPSCRAITICCTSSVPSPIVRILASR